MRTGVYLARDERLGAAVPCTAIVHVQPYPPNDSVAIKCTVGNRGFEVPLPAPDDAGFVDDEDSGILILPTPQGTISLVWPDTDSFAELAPGFPDKRPWPDLAGSAEIQSFLLPFCYLGGED